MGTTYAVAICDCFEGELHLEFVGAGSKMEALCGHTFFQENDELSEGVKKAGDFDSACQFLDVREVLVEVKEVEY